MLPTWATGIHPVFVSTLLNFSPPIAMPCPLCSELSQAVGQLFYIRPFVDDFSPAWVAGSSTALVAGAMALVYIADTISELKLGNGTSVLIFANIASALPASVGELGRDAGSRRGGCEGGRNGRSLDGG